MADIFISYAKEDRSRVEPLARLLEAQGWSVWWDPKIPTGRTWADVIEQALKDARCVVVVWSSRSVGSDWVKKEARRGLKRKVLLPVLIEDSEIPFEFEEIQAANLVNWRGARSHSGVEILLGDIRATLGSSPTSPEEKAAPKGPAQDAAPAQTMWAQLRASLIIPLSRLPVLASLVVVLGVAGYGVYYFDIFNSSPTNGITPGPTPAPVASAERKEAVETSQSSLKGSEEQKQPVEAPKKPAAIQAPIAAKHQPPPPPPPPPPQIKEKKQPLALAKVPTYEAPREPAEEITGKDGAPMVRVPAGEFLYGDNNQRITLPVFYMDKFEVTTARYARFMAETRREKPIYWEDAVPVSFGDRPVVGVTWHDADAYCRYYGKRLPTEQEWEKAARGTDGRKYPWGKELPTSRHANFEKSKWEGYTTLATVESYEAGKSPYGIYHMAGNVWEWTSSDYDNNNKVDRGGSWVSFAFSLESTFRTWWAPSLRNYYRGFRCLQDSPQ